MRLDLNDNWTITPKLMAQEQKTNGTFGYDPSSVTQGHAQYPERSKDRWYAGGADGRRQDRQSRRRVRGRYLKRDVDTESDYSDYSYWYDVAYYALHNDDPDLRPFGTTCTTTPATPSPLAVHPGQGRYKRRRHELRFATPAENRWRFVGGLFTQRQKHDIEQRYKIDDLTTTCR